MEQTDFTPEYIALLESQGATVTQNANGEYIVHFMGQKVVTEEEAEDAEFEQFMQDQAGEEGVVIEDGDLSMGDDSDHYCDIAIEEAFKLCQTKTGSTNGDMCVFRAAIRMVGVDEGFLNGLGDLDEFSLVFNYEIDFSDLSSIKTAIVARAWSYFSSGEMSVMDAINRAWTDVEAHTV